MRSTLGFAPSVALCSHCTLLPHPIPQQPQLRPLLQQPEPLGAAKHALPACSVALLATCGIAAGARRLSGGVGGGARSFGSRGALGGGPRRRDNAARLPLSPLRPTSFVGIPANKQEAEAEAKLAFRDIEELTSPGEERQQLLRTMMLDYDKAKNTYMADVLAEEWYSLDDRQFLPQYLVEVCGRMVSFWSYRGNADRADLWMQRLFTDDPSQDGRLVSGVRAHQPTGNDAWSYCWDAIINVHVAAGNTSKAVNWLNSMLACDLKPQAGTGSAIIHHFLEIGNLEFVEQYMQKLCQCDAHPSWHAFKSVVQSCARRGLVREAQHWFKEAIASGTRVDVAMCSALINAFANRRTTKVNKARVSLAEDVVEQMKKTKVAPNVYIYGSLIAACARSVDAERAEHWLQQMSSQGIAPNEIVCRSVMNACAASGKPEKAQKWFDEMVRLNLEPGDRGFVTMVKAYSESGDMKRASAMIEEMHTKQMHPEERAYGALIGGFAKLGDVSQAVKVFRQLESKGIRPNIVHVNQVIDACGRAAPPEPQRAEELLRQALAAGLEPSVVTLLNLQKAMGKEPARKLLEDDLGVDTKSFPSDKYAGFDKRPELPSGMRKSARDQLDYKLRKFGRMPADDLKKS